MCVCHTCGCNVFQAHISIPIKVSQGTEQLTLGHGNAWHNIPVHTYTHTHNLFRSCLFGQRYGCLNLQRMHSCMHVSGPRCACVCVWVCVYVCQHTHMTSLPNSLFPPLPSPALRHPSRSPSRTANTSSSAMSLRYTHTHTHTHVSTHTVHKHGHTHAHAYTHMHMGPDDKRAG